MFFWAFAFGYTSAPLPGGKGRVFRCFRNKNLPDMIKFNVVFPRANLINIIKRERQSEQSKKARFML